MALRPVQGEPYRHLDCGTYLQPRSGSEVIAYPATDSLHVQLLRGLICMPVSPSPLILAY